LCERKTPFCRTIRMLDERKALAAAAAAAADYADGQIVSGSVAARGLL
jgi:hypothetical protein